jgi:hypothetical protein
MLCFDIKYECWAIFDLFIEFGFEFDLIIMC